MTELSLYEALGVSRLAQPDEIMKAYKKKAIEYHPDKNPHRHATEAFKRIQQAKSILLDPKERSKYDSSVLAEELRFIHEAGSPPDWNTLSTPIGGQPMSYWRPLSCLSRDAELLEAAGEFSEESFNNWVKQKRAQQREEGEYLRFAADARRKFSDVEKKGAEDRRKRGEDTLRVLQRETAAVLAVLNPPPDRDSPKSDHPNQHAALRHGLNEDAVSLALITAHPKMSVQYLDSLVYATRAARERVQDAARQAALWE